MNSSTILEKLKGRQVLIVGDVMLDRYLTGSVTRISPEAPVPVVLHSHTEDRLGGAANVALNIQALGSTPILCSVIGRDRDAQELYRIFSEQQLSVEGLVASTERRTTVKTRVLGNHQQMLRIDAEDTHELSAQETADFLLKVAGLLDNLSIEVVILQDYNKGVLTKQVIETVIRMASERGILTAVDPKKSNFFEYRSVDLFKPNLKEIRDSAPFSIQPESNDLEKASAFLRSRLDNKLTMITLSEKGLYLHDGNAGKIYPTIPRTVADVSGAGDTVISISALALAAGLPMPVIAVLSNLSGGQVCEFAGVVPVRRDLLEAELESWIRQQSLEY